MPHSKNKISGACNIAFCLFMVFIMTFPYLNMVLSSFKEPMDVISTNPSIIPKSWTLTNYQEAFTKTNPLKYFFNSFISSGVSLAFALLFGSMAAYAISRLTLRKSSKIASAFLPFSMFLRIIPLICTAIPMFDISISLHVYDSLVILIAFYTAFQIPFVIWVMTSFFDGMPLEVEEAAMVDGCNIVDTFIRVVLPMTKVGLASTAILSFIMPWNDFQFALLVTSTNAKTLPVALPGFVTSFEISLAPMTAGAVQE